VPLTYSRGVLMDGTHDRWFGGRRRPTGRRGGRRRRLPTAAVAAILLALAVAACSPSASHADADGDWVLVSGDTPEGPIEIVTGYEPTLTVHGREVSGHAGCNQFGTAEGPDSGTNGEDAEDAEGSDRDWPTEFFSTMMACDPPEVMTQEAMFLDALSKITDVQTGEEELVLTGPQTELRFAPVSG